MSFSVDFFPPCFAKLALPAQPRLEIAANKAHTENLQSTNNYEENESKSL